MPYRIILNLKNILMKPLLILSFSAHLNQGELFPLDGAGGFGGYIINYAVYVFYLVCDTI